MDNIDRALINRLQRGFPIVERPYLQVAQELGLGEEELIGRLGKLHDLGVLSRFGPLYQAERMGGAYTLAAMQVPEADYDRVAGLVNGHPEVAHNYRREHTFNMWFVMAALSPASVTRTLSEIERDCAYPVFEFQKLREYFVDLDLPV
jgi:DNA-binding Lrp family transcriptional regulator